MLKEKNKNNAEEESVLSIDSSGNLEINLLGKDRLKKIFKENWTRTRPIALLITTLLSMLMATFSWFKPVSKKTTEITYTVLSDKIKELSDQLQKNHDDIVALKGYIDGMNQKSQRTDYLIQEIRENQEAKENTEEKNNKSSVKPVTSHNSHDAMMSVQLSGDSPAVFGDPSKAFGNLQPTPTPTPAPIPVPPISDKPKPIIPPSFSQIDKD